MGPPSQKITAQIACLKEYAGNLRVKKDSCSDEDDCSFGSGGNSSLAIAVKFDYSTPHFTVRQGTTIKLLRSSSLCQECTVRIFTWNKRKRLVIISLL